jgi:predicted permease
MLDPRGAPFLPRTFVGTVARYTFHTLTLSLIYSTIAVSVSPQSIGNYWFLIVGGWVVLGTSYLVATVLRYFIPINNQEDFVALRVAATYPNIVAIPILIQPSLCEFSVVYEGYAGDYVGGTTEDASSGDVLRRECIAQSTTMIFCYFFAWSLAFWSFGYPQLMRAAKANNVNLRVSSETSPEGNSHHTTTSSVENSNSSNFKNQCNQRFDNFQNGGTLESTAMEDTRCQQVPNDKWSRELGGEASPISGGSQESHTVEPPVEVAVTSCSCPQPATTVSNAPATASVMRRIWNTFEPIWHAVKQTITSPGFIAMVLAFITACIPPLQRALFEPGGSLRFFGSAVEALGTASSPISTMVVAASLVPPEPLQNDSTVPER